MNQPNQVEATRRVLLESLTVLGAALDGLVIVGGAVPELRLPGHQHPGTLDVDLAVDETRIPKHVYESIPKRLLAANFRASGTPDSNMYFRDLGELSVKVDIVTGMSESQNSVLATPGMLVPRLKGIEIGIRHSSTIKISGELPDGCAECSECASGNDTSAHLHESICIGEGKRKGCIRHC